MVVVTHEMEFARAVSDQVVFLEKGKLIEQAPPEEFFTVITSYSIHYTKLYEPLRKVAF